MSVFPPYELQSVPVSADLETRQLYYRCEDWNRYHIPTVHADRKGVTLVRGGGLNFNTYFGSLYEAYWLRYTDVKDFQFCFTLRGAVRMRLFRHSGELGTILLHDAEYAGDGVAVSVAVPHPGAYTTMHGRVFAVLTAREDDTVVTDLCWRTHHAPQQGIRPSIAVCTYNRDEDLTAALDHLTGLQAEGLLADINIVNHGAAGLGDRLRAALPWLSGNNNLFIYEQANLGGAAGFARNMMEILKRDNSTHIVMMDDDIRIDAQIMRRLPVLLGYVKDKIAIGTYFLNKLKPADNVHIGATIDFIDFYPGPSRHREDITSPQALDLYAQVEFCDYVSWWCIGFATKEIAKTGLPLPFFFQFDDVEFGPRLRRKAEVESVNWPGLAIWHEPPYTKMNAVKLYYFCRNAMFVIERHTAKSRWDLVHAAWVTFRSHMVQLYYHRAWAVVKAMEDFVAGPDVLAAWTADMHRALVAEEKLWTQPDLPLSTALPRARLTGRAPKSRFGWHAWAVWRIFTDMIRPAKPSAPLLAVDYKTQWHVWAAKGQDNLAVNHDRADVYHVYHRDPAKVRQLVCRFIRAAWAIAFSPKIHHRQQAMDHLTTQAFWEEKLARKPIDK